MILVKKEHQKLPNTIYCGKKLHAPEIFMGFTGVAGRRPGLICACNDLL